MKKFDRNAYLAFPCLLLIDLLVAVAGSQAGSSIDGNGLDDDQVFLRETRMVWFLANRPGINSETISSRQATEMRLCADRMAPAAR
jgi:hypothetical protein